MTHKEALQKIARLAKATYCDEIEQLATEALKEQTSEPSPSVEEKAEDEVAEN